MYLSQQREVTSTEHWDRKPDHVDFRPVNLLYGRNVYEMELCGYQNTKKDVGSGSNSWDFRGEPRLCQEQDENHSCFILVKDLASLCPCPSVVLRDGLNIQTVNQNIPFLKLP